MSYTLENQQKIVSVNSGNLNLPMNNIMDRDGHWYYYQPLNANNSAIPSSIVPYHWDTILPLVGPADELLQIDGTMPLVREVWNGANNFYHGGTIELSGPGVNNITATQEDDAFFFGHMSALAANTTDNNAFYWDNAFQASDGDGDWDYYQYHQHLPSFYSQYEDGRLTTSGGLYIVPEDKAYAYLIHTRVSVSGTSYQSVLARIHTPSVGGAHNSHNDVTLPTASNKNYIMGGIIKGIGNRFHAFYFAAEGSQWTIYNRTYISASASFSSQIELGTFDLADPTFTFGSTLHNYPMRVSCGDTFGQRIYFPVIMNNATSGFDLEIWSFNSNDTIAGGSLIRTVLISGTTQRPDCMLLNVGDSLHATVSNIASGGISFYSTSDGTTWEASTNQIVTNGSAQPLRIHGLRYNQQDVNYYVLLSGTSTATGTYDGPGLYQFKIQSSFNGYKHLDYDHTNNSFVNKGPLTNGHLSYTKSTGTITRFATQEPEGIASTVNILNYTSGPQDIFNKVEISLQGDEFIYQGIILHDGRKVLAGRVKNLKNKTYDTSSLLAIINSQDSKTNYSFAFDSITGDAVDPQSPIVGDNYITGIYQSHLDKNKIWFTGYCKSELVPKKDIEIHGYCRNLKSGGADQLQWNAIALDSVGDIYNAGADDGGSALIAKYSVNYVLQWKKEIQVTGLATVAYGIAVDSSDNVYVVGTLLDPNTPGSNRSAFVAKYNSLGEELWTKTYANGQITEGKSICVIQNDNTDYIIVSAISGDTSPFDSTILVLDTDGDISDQSLIENVSITKVKDNKTDNGRFIFVGTNHSTSDSIFGMCDITLPNIIQWTSTYSATSSVFNDIDRASAGVYIVSGSTSTNALVLRANVSEISGVYTVTKAWAKTLPTSSYLSVVANTTKIYCVGMATAGGSAAMGMNEGVVASYDVSDGTCNWKNAFGHDMDEAFTGVTFDITTKNIIACGWSESHSTSRDAIIFRMSTGGFGTGVYHITGNAGVPYYYVGSTLIDATDASTISAVIPTEDSIGIITSSSSTTFIYASSNAAAQIFDGSYGGNGVFMLHFGYIDLVKVAEYQNTDEYKDNIAAGNKVSYTDYIWNFWQVATVGDGSADDGNVFGYDIIEATDGSVYIIGQVSGDITKTNTGASGVYDYLLVKFDPQTEEIEYYQNGTERDEETYALTELENGKIAFVGTTTGTLGNTNLGGYDIFLGIYDPVSETFVYRSTGSGLDDRALNVHDMGSNNLAVVYSTYGDFGGTNIGPQDVGVAYYNYSTNEWGNAYLTGTTSADLFDQNGKPSAKLDNGTIAIGFSTAGVYNPDINQGGFLDIAIAIFDPMTTTFYKGQVGSQSSEILTSVSARGERGIFTGYILDTFGEGVQGIFGEGDVITTIGAKSSSQ